jgi:hypothetical protein
MNHLFEYAREFPVITRTDRDAEMPLLLEYINSRAETIPSLLDIGAHYSGHYYAKNLRDKVVIFDGIDILPVDEETLGVHENYFTGNAGDFEFKRNYDTVICVSTIEHAGVSTYKSEYVQERLKLFRRCLDLAEKHVWISFPVGQTYLYPNELAVIDKDDLRNFEAIAKDLGWDFIQRFVYTQGAQAGLPWREHENKDLALSIPYISTNGNQSICVMELDKNV